MKGVSADLTADRREWKKHNVGQRQEDDDYDDAYLVAERLRTELTWIKTSLIPHVSSLH